MPRLLLAALLLSLPARAETLVLLSKCERADCLVMDLSTTGPKAYENKRPVKGGEEMTFSVRGKPGKGHDRSLQLVFHRKPGTPECQGLGPVAVAGISEDRPILLTNAGPVEITDGSLIAGCANCLKVVDPDSGKTLSEPPSPSRDPGSYGFSAKDFSVDSKGIVWLRTDDTHCLKLGREGNFTTGDAGNCKVKEPKLLPTAEGAPETGYWRFEAGRYQLWLAEPKC